MYKNLSIPSPAIGQPYKFGGKELITANGLNEYDFGARRYYQAIPHFTSIDPLCEDTKHLSPYLYCGNNPVNLVDRDGKKFFFTGGSESDYNQIRDWLNVITQGQYTFSYSYDKKTKTAEFDCKENEQFSGELSENNKNLNQELKRFSDDNKAIKVNIRNNSKSIIIGDVTKSAIDMKDIENIGDRKSITSESAFLHELYEQSVLQLRDWGNDRERIGQAHEAASKAESRYMNVSVSSSRKFLLKERSSNIKDAYQLVIPYNPGGAFMETYPATEIIKLKNGAIIRQ